MISHVFAEFLKLFKIVHISLNRNWPRQIIHPWSFWIYGRIFARCLTVDIYDVGYVKFIQYHFYKFRIANVIGVGQKTVFIQNMDVTPSYMNRYSQGLTSGPLLEWRYHFASAPSMRNTVQNIMRVGYPYQYRATAPLTI